jgi:hypothetical protein
VLFSYLLFIKSLGLLSLVRLSPGRAIFSTGFCPFFDRVSWDSGCPCLPEVRLCRLFGLGLMFLATGGAEGFSGDGGIRAAYATAELLVPFAYLGGFVVPIFS